MSFFGSLLVITIFYGVGFSLLSCLRIVFKSIIEKLGYAYGLGAAAITLQMLFYAFVNLHWTLFNILAPWSILILYVISKQRKFPQIYLKRANLSLQTMVLLMIIGTLCLFVLIESVMRGVSAWDGWASWFLHGKTFYLAKTIDFSAINYAETSNPPVINLLVAFTFLVSGKIHDAFSLLPFAFFYISTLFVFYGSLRKNMSQASALFLTLLLASVPNIIRHGGRFDVGNADLPLGYFLFAGSVCLVNVRNKIQWQWVALGTFFLTVGALIKSEGIPFFVLCEGIILFLLVRKKHLKYILIPLAGLAIILAWQVCKIHFHLPNNPFVTGNIQLGRIPSITIAMLKEMFNFGRWYFLWLVFLISLIIQIFRRSLTIFSLLVVLQLGVYFLIYLMTPVDPVSHIGNSFDRLLLHIAPLALYAGGLVMFSKDKSI